MWWQRLGRDPTSITGKEMKIETELFAGSLDNWLVIKFHNMSLMDIRFEGRAIAGYWTKFLAVFFPCFS